MFLQLAKVLDTTSVPAFVLCFMLAAVPIKGRNCFGEDYRETFSLNWLNEKNQRRVAAKKNPFSFSW